MNFLERFAAIEKECEQEQVQVSGPQHVNLVDDEDEGVDKSETETNAWIEKKVCKPEDKVKLRTNTIKSVPLSTLVWATLLNIRGGSAFVFARICNQAESAHYRFHAEELDNDGLIPEGKVVVEYFSLPDNFPQYAIKDPSSLKAFNEPIKKYSGCSKSSPNEWHPENCAHLLKTVLRRKYSSDVAQYIYDRSFAVANEFLRLALSHDNDESIVFSSNSDDLQNVSTTSLNSTEITETPVDMSLFALSNKTTAKRISLKAGSWIGYEDKMFNNTKITQIIEIPKQQKTSKSSSSSSSTSSIVLANGDILFQYDLICKYNEDPSSPSATPSSSSSSHSGYHTLDEYRLVPGKLSTIKTIHHEMAQETKEHLNTLEDESGYLLNRKSQKRKQSPSTKSPQSKKR